MVISEYRNTRSESSDVKAFSMQGDARSSGFLKSLLIIAVWFFAVGSAISVVYSAYSSRIATQKLESLRREAIGLRVISGQYLLEKSSWAEYSRVEQLAREQLSMKIPDGNKTELIFR